MGRSARVRFIERIVRTKRAIDRPSRAKPTSTPIATNGGDATDAANGTAPAVAAGSTTMESMPARPIHAAFFMILTFRLAISSTATKSCSTWRLNRKNRSGTTPKSTTKWWSPVDFSFLRSPRAFDPLAERAHLDPESSVRY